MSDAPLESAPIVLTPPDPVAVVEPADVSKTDPVTLSPEQRQSVDERVNEFVRDLLDAPVDGDAFATRVGAIAKLGSKEIERSAGVSNRLLNRPSASGRQPGKGDVSHTLIDLRNVCEDLDPKNQQPLSAKKVLGLLPFGNRVRSYFQRYEAAQSHLNAIVESLLAGKDELMRDNAAIDAERAEMWSLMTALQQAIYLCRQIDEALSAQIDDVERTDPNRAKRLKENVLFDTRQKLIDLSTQMAVNVQGYLALDVIKRNNAELIKGIDRAKTTTLSALRTAVIVSQALGEQKLVLDRIGALQETTGSLIQSTSEMLRAQSLETFQKASDPTIAVDRLEAAFQNVYATIDTIDDYKVKSLDSMSQTVAALTQQVERAQTVLARERARHG